MVVTRYLGMIGTLAIHFTAVYDGLLSEIFALVETAMRETASESTVIGAVMLVESMLSVLDVNRLQSAFDQLNAKLRDVATFFLAKYTETQGQLLAAVEAGAAPSPCDPLVVQLMLVLDVLAAWARMHERLLELDPAAKGELL